VERPAVLEAGSLRLDPGARTVARGDVDVDVTSREFAVLEYLIRHRDLVVSKRDILAGVWDEDFDGDPNIVEVYIGHLRQKIDRPFGQASIQTVRGAGYRLVSDG
jgi:DNA-binding response OmpR family regulator